MNVNINEGMSFIEELNFDFVGKDKKMALSAETQAKIDQALSDKQAAKDADNTDVEAKKKLDDATQAQITTQQSSIDAHKKALDSAHTAIDALTSELSGD